MFSTATTFPIDAALPKLRARLRDSRNLVLSAPPGAGKTTRVPLALLDEEWMRGRKILMLEPRRLAARCAAEFMSARLGERLGQTVGYKIRGDAVVGSRTRVEVVTEGILTRMLHHDPDLPGTALVIFDEFHERSIHADLGLALTLDLQRHLREDLRILVMSATLDASAVAGLIGGESVVSEGKSFPVETVYAKFRTAKPLAERTIETIRRALEAHTGDVLVFLPGRREIRQVDILAWEKGLRDDVLVCPLFGDATHDQQDAALSPAPEGKRKVILSTSIAETSLTIQGVRVVIDSGLARTAEFDARTGMAGLVTTPVSKAVSDQRRGRAGRQEPGVCFRLWTEEEHARLPEYPQPEIRTADLAQFAVDVARWGDPSAETLKFIDRPPLHHLNQARSLLMNLGITDERGKLTAHGLASANLPAHPRLAHMVVLGTKMGLGSLACEVAALLEESASIGGKAEHVELDAHLDALHSGRSMDQTMRARVLAQAGRLRDLTGPKSSRSTKQESPVGILLALAYPDRVARMKEEGRYQLANGRTAILPAGSPLLREEFIAVAAVDDSPGDARILLATRLTKQNLLEIFEKNIVQERRVAWDSRERAVVSVESARLASLVIAERSVNPDGSEVVGAMIEGIRETGINALPWSKESRALQSRNEWVRLDLKFGPTLPDLSNGALLGSLDDWLSPFLGGVRSLAQLQELDLSAVLRGRFTHKQMQMLDRLAPPHITLPSGSRVALEYNAGTDPVLAVRLQEMFGLKSTPTVGERRVAAVVHLLSPARRPLAVTSDLSSFWKNVYPEIRTQMRARYPKHRWPEDPLRVEQQSFRVLDRKSKAGRKPNR